MLQNLMGFKLVRGAKKRSETATARIRLNTPKREARREPKGVSYAMNAVIKKTTKTGMLISITLYTRIQN